MSQTQWYKWFKHFKEDIILVNHDSMPRLSCTSTDDNHDGHITCYESYKLSLTISEAAEDADVSIWSWNQTYMIQNLTAVSFCCKICVLFVDWWSERLSDSLKFLKEIEEITNGVENTQELLANSNGNRIMIHSCQDWTHVQYGSNYTDMISQLAEDW